MGAARGRQQNPGGLRGGCGSRRFQAPGDGCHPYRRAALRRPWLYRGRTSPGAARARLVVAHSPYGKTALKIFAYAIAWSLVCANSGASTLPARSVPLCSGITLSASYLAMTGPHQVPGFHFILSNRTSREIKLAEPVPSSSHSNARARGKRWWRASNGAGGSLVNAGNEHGRVMVYPNQNPVGAGFLT